MDARYRLKFKKRKTGKTNYKKRYNLLLSNRPRIVTRITNKQIIVQSIKYSASGDQTIAQATSGELKALGWKQSKKNIPSAYLTGLLCAKRAVEKNSKTGISDFGLHTAHAKGRIFSALKGAIDGGIDIPHDESTFPDEKRISGAHLKKDSSTEFNTAKQNILTMKHEKKDTKTKNTKKHTEPEKKKDDKKTKM